MLSRHPFVVALGALCAALLWLSLSLREASAQPTTKPAAPAPSAMTAPDGPWSDIMRWLDGRTPARCTQRCYFLEKLRITGAVNKGQLSFELEGGVLATGSYEVPIFGPAGSVEVEDAKEDGKPAVIGFEKGAYFLVTSARRFKLTGRLSFRNDATLLVPGPLNRFEADLTSGRVVEGGRQSGLTDATLHFDPSAEDKRPEATLFQVARAVRVAKETQMEVRISLSSGKDLGIVEFPLAYGEKVLDVRGGNGAWKVEGGKLIVPVLGRSAVITFTAALPKVDTFAIDPRSSYEHWLFESDPDHRLLLTGDAKQIDSAQSPIARTRPTARLYLLLPGQKLSLKVQQLMATEVLSAIVKNLDATVVLTRRGETIHDVHLRYENSGVDYLPFHPVGTPIFMATDGTAERLMQGEDDAKAYLLPLQKGSHRAHIQSTLRADLASLGGTIRLATLTQPLRASEAHVTLGLPAGVHPLVVLGGDTPYVAWGLRDALAILLSAVLGALLVRGPLRKIGLGVALSGLWLLAPPVFAILVGGGLLAGAIWLAHRLLPGPWRVMVPLGMAGTLGIGLLVLVGTLAVGGMDKPRSTTSGTTRSMNEDASAEQQARAAKPGSPLAGEAESKVKATTGNVAYQQMNAGMLAGVTPVALPLPQSERFVHLRRTLVTSERPIQPVLVYITESVVLPLELSWVLLVLGLLYSFRGEFRKGLDTLRVRLKTPAEPPIAQSAAATATSHPSTESPSPVDGRGPEERG